MKCHSSPYFILLGLSLFFASSLHADEILLKNGDRITGEVVNSKDGKLVIKTSYAGNLTIDMAAISSVTTEKPMTLLLEGDQLSQVNALDLAMEAERDAEIVAVNPEPWRYGQGYRFKGIVNLAFEIKDGNTNSDELDIDGNLELRRKRDRFKLAGEFEFDKSNGETTKDKQWLIGSYDYFPDRGTRWGLAAKRWYYGLGGSLERDKLASLRLRTVVGPHVGYQFFESKAMNLLLESGPSFVTEDFSNDSSDANYWALGWKLDFDRYLLNEVTQFYHRQSAIWELGGDTKLVHKSWTGFRFPLYAGFVASAEIKLDYDGAPADEAKKMDTTYNFKLGYTW